MLWGKIRESEGQQLQGIEFRTPGLHSQCSATEIWQLENHQPSQSSICTETPQAHTQQLLSMCCQNNVRSWMKNILDQEKMHTEWFSHTKYLNMICNFWGLLATKCWCYNNWHYCRSTYMHIHLYYTIETDPSRSKKPQSHWWWVLCQAPLQEHQSRAEECATILFYL